MKSIITSMKKILIVLLLLIPSVFATVFPEKCAFPKGLDCDFESMMGMEEGTIVFELENKIGDLTDFSLSECTPNNIAFRNNTKQTFTCQAELKTGYVRSDLKVNFIKYDSVPVSEEAVAIKRLENYTPDFNFKKMAIYAVIGVVAFYIVTRVFKAISLFIKLFLALAILAICIFFLRNYF